MKKHCEILGYKITEEECTETKDLTFDECQECGEKEPLPQPFPKGRGGKNKNGRQRISREGVKCSDCGKKASEDSYFRFNRGKCCVCVSRDDRAKKKGEKPAAKGRVEKRTPSPVPHPGEAKAETSRVVSLDFSAHPELYDQLATIAGEELRDIDKQIFYFLKKGDFSGLSKQI